MLRRRKWESAALPPETVYTPPEDQGLQDALRRLPEPPESGTRRAEELVQDFLESACTSRELLLSLVDRVELDRNRHLEIRFRTAPP